MLITLVWGGVELVTLVWGGILVTRMGVNLYAVVCHGDLNTSNLLDRTPLLHS